MLKLFKKFNNEILHTLEQLGLCNENREYQIYTLNHKQAFMALEQKLRGQITLSGILHDVDKLVLYGLMPKEEASALHRKYAYHHINNCETARDLEDCVIDYECARFTKADKPLNAYNTIFKYCPNQYERLKPALDKFRLNNRTNIILILKVGDLQEQTNYNQ